MLEYDFMRTAFLASGMAAILAGTVGFFLVLRGQTFAGHALAHVGFTGATGAVLIGVSPLAGLVVLTVAAGLGMGFLGERLAQRDVAIGIVLALSLGLGLLFLHFFTAFATKATALLFGNVLAVDAEHIAEQERRRLRRPGGIEMQEEQAETQRQRQHHADRHVTFGKLLAEQSHADPADKCEADQPSERR